MPAKRARQSDYRTRSPKRRKISIPTSTSDSPNTDPLRGARPVYSTRDIPWEEQLTLPERFRTARNVWPGNAIKGERTRANRTQYLVDWEPHPHTGEIFEPTWVGTHVTDAADHAHRHRNQRTTYQMI
jgi:hypothetical protein